MWSAASTSVAALPSPMATFVLGGMNDVLNSQGYTQAAWWNRIPTAAWILLIVISIFCNLLVGYDAPGRNPFLLLILPIFLSISLFLIADIDTPRRGIINVEPQNLESLAESLHTQ
jgi:protein-S-isoprenylcysteine O-methyltransferase Ste14